MPAPAFPATSEAAAQPTGDGLGVLSQAVMELQHDFLYRNLSKRNRR